MSLSSTKSPGVGAQTVSYSLWHPQILDTMCLAEYVLSKWLQMNGPWWGSGSIQVTANFELFSY